MATVRPGSAHLPIDSRLETISRRDFIRMAALAAMFPLVVIANFYLFVWLTRIDLGRWPVFNDPFPKALPGQLQSLSIGLTFVAFPFVSLIAVALSLWGRWRYVDFPLWKLLAAIIACALLLLTMAKFDPGGFLNWFVD
jgi:hypothetical protein